ncbi:MAG: sigma E protease regulator RseP, partial [Enterobacterales bacterium]|nr:sigma E protease regulator RseP [Enterobacterales bacterium]
MLDILWNIGSFIVALGILVTIHEYGHFWVARRCGVKVLKFSVGFGKSIWSHRGKDGTVYTVAAIPLGGYVKMLDEREGTVAPADLPRAFNKQPVTSRIAIVAAGPLANFLLAIFIYAWMYMLGMPALQPYIGDVPEASIAQYAGLKKGDLILAVDDREVGSWQDVNHAVARRMGETEELTLTIQKENESIPRDYVLQLSNWTVDPKQPDLLGTLGLSTWTPTHEPVLGDIVANEAAAKAGLAVGDRIIRIDGQQITTWNDMVAIITARPDQTVLFEIARNGVSQQIDVLLASRTIGNQKQGYLGVSTPDWTEADIVRLNEMRYAQQFGFFESFAKGVDKTWEMILLSFRLVGKLITGDVSPKNLSGPISIAQGAGAYASFGFVFFLSFLAMISVNLGIINILPIPVLDGGHLLYYLIELIRGKPLPDSVQDIGLRIGLMMVLGLMVFSIIN